MSDLLSIGSSGVRAYQAALTTVSENIANTGVEGYSRRSTELREVRVSGGLAASSVRNGLGVTVKGVTRAGDVYSQEAVRGASSDLGRTEVGATWLGGIEGALTGDELAGRLTAFFAAGRSLAAEPASSARRTAMLGAAEAAAGAFTATGRALDQVGADLDANAEEAVRELSQLGGTLAKINLGLARTERGSAAAAQLADQRDQVLESMSRLSDLDVQLDGFGRAAVRLGGKGGPVFVDMAQAGTLAYERSGGAVALTLSSAAGLSAVTPLGGELAGVVDAAQRIDAARSGLNAVAARFMDDVNTVQAAGEDLAGDPGEPMFAAGASPSDLVLVLADGDGIAAAAPDGGPRDGSNLDGFEAMRTSTGPEASVLTLVTENASALRQRKAVADAQTAIKDGAITARASKSGVDLDGEAVDLLRFQQAYQASSRVIQTARDVFQTLFEIR